MITGYKKKKLGHPSEKLSGDVPRATWRTVIVGEIIWPICVSALFIVAYMFVKSFPDANGVYPPSPLIRIAVVSVGPVVWNAAILVALFCVSLFLGPMMESWGKFGSVMASLAHILSLVGLVAFFEFFVRHRRRSTMIFTDDNHCHSGSLNSGMLRTPCWVLSPSLRSRGLFRRFSLPSS